MKQRFPSEKTLMKHLGVNRGKARRIRLVVKNVTATQGDFTGPICDTFSSVQKWVGHCHNLPRLAERQMCALDEILETHGVESIQQDGSARRRVAWRHNADPYWYDTVLLYCNNGDTYQPTIAYDTMEQRFILTSWGDWFEKNMITKKEYA